jgi:hypothetical protein
MNREILLTLASIPSLAFGPPQASVVPTEIQQPGTQPAEVTLESVTKCDNCHGGYHAAVEPVANWHGSMMALAGRDPIFWATVAVAEEDFSGAGDLCIRCHSPEGWIGGRSTPTDGSALASADAFGVSCDVCHQLVNPDDSEHAGVQNAPFVANDGRNPATGYQGSGMYVLYGGTDKLGPYSDPASPHPALRSRYHRDPALCGTCHDVSNPAVGDLAPNNGAMVPLEPGTFSGVLGAPVTQKAAFNNFPFAYGTVERTYSEHVASLLDTTRVQDYASLPAELRAGALASAHAAATAAVPGGDYADGAERFFTCQTCHMRAVQGKGCNKQAAPVRADLPLHDMTGGNTWMPDAIRWLAERNELPLGNTLSAAQLSAMEAGQARALVNLTEAASLQVSGNVLRIVNLTGHKLLSGYPEGRRMWPRIVWYDAGGSALREDGAYGPITTVTVGGTTSPVSSILDLDDPNTRIYQAHMGMTREWAVELLALGYPPALPLEYERVTGAPGFTLGDLAAQPAGTTHESFHFVLNDVTVADDRIPPYGMSYDEALARSALPVPADQYGDPGPGGRYLHYDELALHPPIGAQTATIELLYQSTSWEYVQFLYLANAGTIPFLADTGEDLLLAWLATGMAAPVVMASITWTAMAGDCNNNGVLDALDISGGASADCNHDGLPDECDIAFGFSWDRDDNGIPDECESTKFRRARRPPEPLD